ncbi:MAG TPA: antibiotic biosynthesis monooxygenase [Candidatus Koribacter sp.]|jgi:quinol monooxygenase YgiN
MEKFALSARLEAKPGKEKDVENLLRSALSIVQQEQGTTTWYAFRIGPTSFGIFDAFPDESGRQAHLAGKVVDALKANAELFVHSPQIEKLEILASKNPQQTTKAA